MNITRTLLIARNYIRFQSMVCCLATLSGFFLFRKNCKIVLYQEDNGYTLSNLLYQSCFMYALSVLANVLHIRSAQCFLNLSIYALWNRHAVGRLTVFQASWLPTICCAVNSVIITLLLVFRSTYHACIHLCSSFHLCSHPRCKLEYSCSIVQCFYRSLEVCNGVTRGCCCVSYITVKVLNFMY